MSARPRATVRRGGLLLMTSMLMLVACSGSGRSASPTPATPATTAVSAATQATQPIAGATETECRDALLAFDAYSLAKQNGAADATAAAAARARCLATSDVPASCREAMTLSVTMQSASGDSVEFFSAFTAYREASTLCRVKLLKSI